MRIIIDDRNKTRKLKAQTAIVLGVIEKYTVTGERKGWFGTYEALSEACPAIVPRSTVGDVVKELLTLGLIEKRGNALFAVRDSDVVRESDESVRETDEVIRSTDAEIRVSDSPLNNPPIKSMNDPTEGQMVTHMPEHDANSQAPNYTFKEFCDAYRARGGTITIRQQSDCYDLWQGLDPIVQSAIMEELAKKNGFWKPRPDWLLSDYRMPPPKNYNYTGEFTEMVKKKRMVSAQYNGEHGIYTLEDAEKHHLPINYGMNFNYEQYLKEKEQNNEQEK